MIEESVLEKKISKLEKKLDDTFISDVKASSTAALKETALKYAKEMERIEEERDADETLQALANQKKELGAGYAEARKAAKLRLQYVLALMKLNGAE